MSEPRIHFVSSPAPGGEKRLARMASLYGQSPLEEADVIVAMGGDGFMLRTLHRFIEAQLPVYGMKTGNVGFLMNLFREKELRERLQEATEVSLHPLRMAVETESGNHATSLAINEVSLLRQTNQAAHIRILINDTVKVAELVCDGVLLSTAAGSTAYNLSAHGPILPLGTDALALTPISPFRPRRWNGAVLPGSARVRFEIIHPYKRSVSATADAHEIRNVTSVEAFEDRSMAIKLLFDPDHSLEERILNEQFL